MKRKLFALAMTAMLLCAVNLNVLAAASGNNASRGDGRTEEQRKTDDAVQGAIGGLQQNGTATVTTDRPISAGQMRQVMEANGTLVVNSGSVSWHFNNITNPGDFIPKVNINPSLPEITAGMGGVQGTVLQFEHNGALPGTASVAVNVGYAPGTQLYFYYYNWATHQFEFLQRTTVAAGGYAVVTLTHCSDYVLTTSPLTANVTGGAAPAANTNAASTRNLDVTPHTGL